MKTKLLFFAIAISLVSGSVLAETAATPTSTKDQAKSATNQTTQQLCNTKKHSNRPSKLERDVRYLKAQVAELQDAKEKGKSMLGELAEVYAHGPAVVTSPAFGVRRSAEDASDLMVSLSSMNEDLQILNIRRKLENYAKCRCIKIPDHPILSISGGLEGQITEIQNYTHQDRVDVDLTRAELDFIGEASPWATGTIILSYDNGAGNGSGAIGYPNRINNSRLYLSRGFLTIGQLNKFPGYFTLGQIYLPFGRYSSYRLSSPTTQVIGRIRQRAALIGFEYQGLYGQLYGYPGQTHVEGQNEIENRGGANLGYKYSVDNFSMDVGAGYTGNMAESQGMLDNGYSNPAYFKGFDANRELQDRIPGADAYAKFSLKPFTVLGEFITATERFSPLDMSFDGKGARPAALDVEAAYEFKLFCRPNTFAIGYGQTWEALALNVPKNDFFAEYNISIWKDTIESLEYRHNINYSSSDYATGNNPVVGQQAITIPGKTSNSVIFQLGIYF